jgi:hypothetical protein
MEWIDVAHETDRWRARVNAVMNLWILYNAWNFLTRCRPVSYWQAVLIVYCLAQVFELCSIFEGLLATR